MTGFIVIEVITSLSIIATVFFSLLFYQMLHVKMVHAALYQSIARNELDNYVGMFRSHQQDNDIYSQWDHEIKELLPKARGEIIMLRSHICRARISWFYTKQRSESIVFLC